MLFNSQMCTWNGDVTMSEEQELHMRSTAASHDYFGTINKENAIIVAEQIMMHEVIYKRRAQLEMIKSGFTGHRLSDFIQRNTFLKDGLFPRSSALRVTPMTLLQKLEQRCSEAHFSVVKQFIQSIDGKFNY